MKKNITLIIAFLLYSNLFADELRAYYYYVPFYNSETGCYIENYLTVVGETAVYRKNASGKYQASIEITMLFKKEGKILHFTKYVLNSPESEDSLTKHNFIDLQRIPLDEGIYNFEMKITDLNADRQETHTFYDIINIVHNKDKISLSGVEFIEKYSETLNENKLSKNGYDLTPYVADYYPQSINNFTFYFEIYNSKAVLGERDTFLMKYYIESMSLKTLLQYYVKTKKLVTADIIPVLGEFNIGELISGNYNFVIELINKDNLVIGQKKVFFQRSNPKTEIDLKKYQELNISHTFAEYINSKDTLTGYIKSLYPISTGVEYEHAINAVKSGNITNMQKYFYGFWKIRNPLQPEEEWKKYLAQVNYVNKLYGYLVKKGYETDRGRVYLQYGAPNNVVQRNFTGETYDYEIWHYYSINDQRNKRFVFYNPELTGKDFYLLHSDVVGEIQTPNWQWKLIYPYPSLTQQDLNKWKLRINEDYQK